MDARERLEENKDEDQAGRRAARTKGIEAHPKEEIEMEIER